MDGTRPAEPFDGRIGSGKRRDSPVSTQSGVVAFRFATVGDSTVRSANRAVMNRPQLHIPLPVILFFPCDSAEAGVDIDRATVLSRRAAILDRLDASMIPPPKLP